MDRHRLSEERSIALHGPGPAVTRKQLEHIIRAAAAHRVISLQTVEERARDTLLAPELETAVDGRLAYLKRKQT